MSAERVLLESRVLVRTLSGSQIAVAIRAGSLWFAQGGPRRGRLCFKVRLDDGQVARASYSPRDLDRLARLDDPVCHADFDAANHGSFL